MKSGGVLRIVVQTIENGVRIEVSDNGAGRKAVSQFKDSSGNGLKIMDEYYKLFEKYHGYKINCEITDGLSPNGESEGTIVVLRIQK